MERALFPSYLLLLLVVQFLFPRTDCTAGTTPKIDRQRNGCTFIGLAVHPLMESFAAIMALVAAPYYGTRSLFCDEYTARRIR